MLRDFTIHVHILLTTKDNSLQQKHNSDTMPLREQDQVQTLAYNIINGCMAV